MSTPRSSQNGKRVSVIDLRDRPGSQGSPNELGPVPDTMPGRSSALQSAVASHKSPQGGIGPQDVIISNSRLTPSIAEPSVRSRNGNLQRKSEGTLIIPTSLSDSVKEIRRSSVSKIERINSMRPIWDEHKSIVHSATLRSRKDRLSAGHVFQGMSSDENVTGKNAEIPQKKSSSRLGAGSSLSESKTFAILSRGIGCLGVIYGDIGTSPLYAMSSVFCNPDCKNPDMEDIRGVLSTFIWTITLVVVVKYLLVIMKHDYFGEGGLFALLLSITRSSIVQPSGPALTAYTVAAAIGASLMLADGLITPALSVLAAVEGLKSPSILSEEMLEHVGVPITVVLLLILYLAQPFGTSQVGRFFGPIILVFLLSIAIIGVYNMASYPTGADVMAGWSPHYAIKFWVVGNYAGLPAFKAMSSIVLCVTGAEALYSDLGHFGRSPIYLSWFVIVYPCLVLAYTGQAAFLASNPEAVHNIFWKSMPSPIYIPMLIICTAATIIASQAMITGSFSLVNQAVALGLFPRVRTVHTDAKQHAQVYIPEVNMFLAVGTLALVVGYKESIHLASAYGIAVVSTFMITTTLLAGKLFYCDGWRWWTSLLAIFPLIFVDLVFLASCFYSKFEGSGYVPIAIAFFLSVVMLCWYVGGRLVTAAYISIREAYQKAHLRDGLFLLVCVFTYFFALLTIILPNHLIDAHRDLSRTCLSAR